MPKKAKKRTELENEATQEEEQTEEVPAAEQDDEEATDEDGPAAGSIDIIKGERTYVRTFSKEVHGADFKDLAKQFVEKEMYAKPEYRMVPSKDVDHLEVFYREKEDAEKHIDQQKPDAPIVDKERQFTTTANGTIVCSDDDGGSGGGSGFSTTSANFWSSLGYPTWRTCSRSQPPISYARHESSLPLSPTGFQTSSEAARPPFNSLSN